MPNKIPEIATLLNEVEKKYGRTISTSSDFEALSIDIEREEGEYLSTSTLKRLWGYVTMRPVPRKTTLDALARYCGYNSFKKYCEELKNSPDNSSNFFSTQYLDASDLVLGDKILIGWAPNRMVTLQSLGNCKFIVLESKNSKLKEGDEFFVSQFLVGYPLYIDKLYRDGVDSPLSYIAGKLGGINRVEKIE